MTKMQMYCVRKVFFIFMLLPMLLLAGCKSKEAKWTVYSGTINVEKNNQGYTVELAPKTDDTTKTEDIAKIDGSHSVEYEGTIVNEEQTNQEEVDLFFFMGQSNMAGYGGNSELAPYVSEEAGMEYRVISDPGKLYQIEEPFGAYENKEGGLSDDDKKAGSLVSAFVNKYYELTGKKIIAVSASVGGMAMDLWLNPNITEDVITRINDSYNYLNDNNYKVNHVYVLWLQGESDGSRGVSSEVYKDYFYQFMDQVLETSVEKVFIITPGRVYYDANAYASIIKCQKEICENDDNFILATDIMSDIDKGMMSDAYHYNQEALNMVGEDAATNVAAYAYELSNMLE